MVPSNSGLTRREIRSKAKEFVASRKNSNNLVEILECVKSKQKIKTAVASILALETMLVHAITSKIPVVTSVKKKKNKDLDVEAEYNSWLDGTYDDTLTQLLSMISSPELEQAAREQALVTYMKLLQVDATNVSNNKDISLHKLNFHKLLKSLIKKGNSKLLSRFQEFSAYHDVAIQIWLSCGTLAKQTKGPLTEDYMKNLLNILSNTAVPDTKLRTKEPDMFFVVVKDRIWCMKVMNKKLSKYIDEVWSHMKMWNHSKAILHTTLILLLEKMMDHLSQPVFLTDFFMTALDKGGAISLLALQGTFNLIQKHNIEYPNVYGKLYSLFTPSIFMTKYKARLFYLADLFLSSTHLPEAIVASYIKRLSRLALLAPATDILIILPFIGNLLIRHKGLQIMAQHPTGGTVDRDPFLDKEKDPMQTRAVESSLWEIKSLQFHVLPAVAVAARFINEKMPTVEWDLSEVLDGTYKEMFQKEMNKKAKEITLTFIRPDTEKLTEENFCEIPCET